MGDGDSGISESGGCGFNRGSLDFSKGQSLADGLVDSWGCQSDSGSGNSNARASRGELGEARASSGICWESKVGSLGQWWVVSDKGCRFNGNGLRISRRLCSCNVSGRCRCGRLGFINSNGAIFRSAPCSLYMHNVKRVKEDTYVADGVTVVWRAEVQSREAIDDR